MDDQRREIEKKGERGREMIREGWKTREKKTVCRVRNSTMSHLQTELPKGLTPSHVRVLLLSQLN